MKCRRKPNIQREINRHSFIYEATEWFPPAMTRKYIVTMTSHQTGSEYYSDHQALTQKYANDIFSKTNEIDTVKVERFSRHVGYFKTRKALRF